MSGSIRNRLLLGTAIGIAIAIAVSGVAVYVLAKRALVSQFDDALHAKARAMSTLVEQDGAVIETDDVSRDAPAGEYFEIFDGAGVSIARSNTAIPAGGVRTVKLEFAPRIEEVETTVARPLATIVYARETRELDATIARIARIILTVGIAALALGIAIAAAIARYALGPLRALGADIAAIEENELAQLDKHRPRELVPIADKLNDLLSRVDRVMKRERALTAEVAHELRTPLAGLRATIELALDRERSNDKYRDALKQCHEITTQTERMVESMLSLAKLDAGMVVVNAEAVELDTLVREVLATHAPRIADRRIGVNSELDAVVARTDRTKLASVLHNLVDNAISYSDERGTIRIEVKAGPTIHVSNTGCTLAPDDVAHVFDRFWRGDRAREAGTHAGLGLSICKTLVDLLGGGITAKVRDGTFIATITLPDAPRAQPRVTG